MAVILPYNVHAQRPECEQREHPSAAPLRYAVTHWGMVAFRDLGRALFQKMLAKERDRLSARFGLHPTPGSGQRFRLPRG